MRPGRANHRILTLALLLSPLLGGCYVMRQGIGQARLLMGRVAVPAYLAGDAPKRDKETVRFILEVKAFGVCRLGLCPDDSYTSVYDTGGRPVVTVVTGCPKDRFEPHTWWFPIVGTVPYLGFFDPAHAREEAEALRRAGLDVSVGGARAYSTLGWFADPILSTMLAEPREDLAELILHELTHAHVYAPGQGDFNESLATFVGRRGALQLFRAHDGPASEIARRAARRYADARRFDALMLSLYRELDAYYESRPADVLVGRERFLARARARYRRLRPQLGDGRFDWFLQRPLNNSVILARRRYGRTAEFERLYEACGKDWRRFFDAVRTAASAEDPFGALARLPAGGPTAPR